MCLTGTSTAIPQTTGSRASFFHYVCLAKVGTRWDLHIQDAYFWWLPEPCNSEYRILFITKGTQLIFIINSFTVLRHNTFFALRICTTTEGSLCSWVFISRVSHEPVWCFSFAPSSKEGIVTAGRRRCRRERVLLVLVSPQIAFHEKNTLKATRLPRFIVSSEHEDNIKLKVDLLRDG